MCNIAGYTGSKDAAAILIGMMRKEEGFSGGYYTGIATLCDGKIHAEKKTGDVRHLLATTPAASLPGTTGIMHSRSDSGGGDEWAHPFLDGYHPEPCLAYVANGYAGCCEKRKAEAAALIGSLQAEGCKLSSRIQGHDGAYMDLPDGSNLHMSDVMCQVISRNADRGMDVAKAMDRAFCEFPSEIVGLVIHKDHPGEIFFARYNFPMFAGFCDHGAYLSSTPLAFPEDVGKVIPVPAMTYGVLTEDGIRFAPLSAPAFTVAEESSRIESKAYEAITKALSEGPRNFRELSHLVKPMFTGADCGPYIHLTHKVLWSLSRDGLLEIREEMRPGCREGLKAPQLMMRLKET